MKDIYIKTDGDVLTVSAKQEGRGSCKEFEQKFTIPSGVKIDKLTSALSKTGILTISAPREPLTVEQGRFQEIPAIADNCTSALVQPSLVYDDEKLVIEVDVKDYKPEDLDVKIDGMELCVTASQDVSGSDQSRRRVFEQKFSLPSGVCPQDVQSSLSRDGKLVITAPRTPVNTDKQTKKLTEQLEESLNPRNWDNTDDYDETAGTRERELTIQPFPFNNTRDQHLTNTRDQQSISPYTFNNGVSRVECDDRNYKILVNVQHFNPEDLVIRTVDDCVIVEANHEEKDGRSYSNKSFSQSFNLPKDINPESVTSALSKDGILTISAPFRQ